MIKILLVDDHELIRIALSQILDGAGDVQVIGQAGSGEEALEQARRLKPDVVIIDVDMPGMGGVEATRRISALPGRPKIIVISVHTSPPYPRRLLEAGASGYLPKAGHARDVLIAVRTVYRGKPFIAAEIASQIALEAVTGNGKSPLDSLSQREMQVMLMLTRGQTLQSIAKSLNLSPKTVATHRYRIYSKLGVANDVALTHMAIRYGVLEET